MSATKARPRPVPLSKSSPDLKTITVEEAAEILRVSVRTIYGMIHRGDLFAKRCGRSYRIDREALYRWMTS